MISVIMCTYNRVHTLPRAIDSVLRQDNGEWELIVVDDGSTDGTAQLLAGYQDPRIRVIGSPQNRGVSAAKNMGLDAIRGDWFTFLDSDDELLGEGAFSTLMRVPREIDQRIDAITCNCVDSVTHKLTGVGLEADQYLDWKTILQRCSGEFWGLTRTSLLEGCRLNEGIRGFEDVLWHKIDKKAHRYYIHQPLRVWHTEGDDRLCKQSVAIESQRSKLHQSYLGLLQEREYMDDLKAYSPSRYRAMLYEAGKCFAASGDTMHLWSVWQELLSSRGGLKSSLKLMIIALREAGSK